MKNKKGFTLIELLAVIVILGIIMVIAVPAITNYIEKAKIDSFKRSTETIFSAATNYLVDNNLDQLPNEGLSITELEYNKTKLTSGLVYSVDEKFEVENVTDGEFCANGTEKDLTVKHEVCKEIELKKPTFKEVKEGYSQSKEVTITYPEGTSYFFKTTNPLKANKKVNKCLVVNETEATCEETKIDENTVLEVNTWYKTETGVKLSLEENTRITAHAYNTRRYIESVKEITKIDRSKPTVSTVSTKSDVSKIEVTALGEDIESGILKYQYSKDDGATWSEVEESNKYTFKDLETGVYKIKVRVINGTYTNEGMNELNYLDSTTKETSTNAIEAPTYTVSPEGYSQSKTVTINYKSGYTNEYKVNGGEWTKYSTPITFKENGTIIARISDGINYFSGSTISVIVDTTAPTLSTFTYSVTGFSITVTASGVDNESGIYGYQFSKDNGTTWTSIQTSNVYTFSGLSRGTIYQVKIKAINKTYIHDGINLKNSLISDVQNCSTNYTVTISSGTGGSASVTSLDVALGGSNTFTVTPNTNYYLSSASCTNGYTINYQKSSAIQTITISNPNVSEDSTCTLTYGTNNFTSGISWPSGSSRYDGWGVDGNGSENDRAHTYNFNSSSFDITPVKTLTFNYASSGDGWSSTTLYLKWNGTTIWQQSFGDFSNDARWNNSGTASVNVSGYTGTGYLTFVVYNTSCGQGGSISSMYATVSY